MWRVCEYVYVRVCVCALGQIKKPNEPSIALSTMCVDYFHQLSHIFRAAFVLLSCPIDQVKVTVLVMPQLVPSAPCAFNKFAI